MIHGLIFHQEDIMILNLYVPNNIISKYAKRKLTDLKRGSSQLQQDILHTSSRYKCRTNKQKFSQDTENLNNTINQADLIFKCRIFMLNVFSKSIESKRRLSILFKCIRKFIKIATEDIKEVKSYKYFILLTQLKLEINDNVVIRKFLHVWKL